MKKRTAFIAAMAAVVASLATVGRADYPPSIWNLAADRKAEPAPNPRVREIIVISKTHYDIGYTRRVKDLIPYYRTAMIDRALKIMDPSADLPTEQQLIWTVPGWVMAKVSDDWAGQTAERKRRLETAIRAGKLVAHALPFTVQSDFMEPEDFPRAFQFSSSVARKYGLPLPRAAKMTDVPSHARALATALARGEVKFMQIGCGWPCGRVQYPPLFWWEGPDGSRVLTLYSSIYGTCTALWPPQWVGKDDPGLGHNLLPCPDWPYRTWPAIVVTPENTGPPSADDIQRLFKEVAQKMPGVKIHMGRLEDFADAILAEHPDLPVIRGEAPDTWIHGIMCDPGGVRLARDTRPLMPAVEALNTQLRAWGVAVPDVKRDLALAYENSVLYSEHTWGGGGSVTSYGEAFQKLPPESYRDLEGSWEDKADYIRTTVRLVRAALETNLAALAQAVDCGGPRVLVYNALPWPRSGVVEVAGRSFLVENVPASGYKTVPLPLPSRPTTSAGDTLENELFKVKLDPARGRITSLVDKRSGREWVDAAAEFGLGQYLNERFDKAQIDRWARDYQQGRAIDTFQKGEWLHPGFTKPGLPADVPYRSASGRNGTVRITRDSLGQSAIMEMPGDAAHHLPASSLRVTLRAGQPYLDLELTIKDKAKDNWPEADWLCLPLKVKDPRFRVGRSLGVMDPARDILRGANRHLYAVGAGVTLLGGDGASISLCPLDHPLISLDTPGIWKFSFDFVPRKPIVFLNLYNNQFNTNYRYWYPGTWSSRVRIWPGADLAVPAMEARLPLLAAVADGPGGALPALRSGLAVSRPGVLVTAFAPDPDGNPGTLLRLWEQAGASGALTVSLPEGCTAASAQPVNLRGEKCGQPLPIRDGKLQFELHAYAPASFVLERE